MESDIFLDSTALIALTNVRDKYHIQANEVRKQLSDREPKFFTTNLVVLEVINFLIKHEHAPHAASELIRYIQFSRNNDELRLIFVDEELWARGCQLLIARPDKLWELTDCISFVVMQDRGIKTAFTADRHFEQAGFKCLLKKG